MQTVRISHSIATMVGVAALATTASGDVADLTSSNDTWIRNGFSYIFNGGNDPGDPLVGGVLDARFSFVPVIQFDLSGLNIDTLNDATLTVTKVPSLRNDGISAGRFAVYGLPSGTTAPFGTVQNWDEVNDYGVPRRADLGFDDTVFHGLDFRNIGDEWSDVVDSGTFTGTSSTENNTGIDRSLLVSLDPEDTDITVNTTETFAPVAGATNNETHASLTGPDLVSFLTERLNSTDNPGLVTFFIPAEIANGQGYGLASQEFDVDGDPLTDPATDGSDIYWPTLSLDFTVGGGDVLEGDYNGDGFVSQGDLDLVLLNWGDAVAPGGFEEGNLPGGGPFDSLMSQNELDGVLLNWGNGSPPDVVAVPEPVSAAVLGFGGLVLLSRRRSA